MAGQTGNPRIPFGKPALTIADQLSTLHKRGMIVADPDRAEHYLRIIGYHRLSGYWFPFQYRDGSQNHDNFRPGTDFETVLDRYVFDQRLRALVMDALERIEIAARSIISNTMCGACGSHWYLDPACFVADFDHVKFLKRVRQYTGVSPGSERKQTDPIAHYVEKYNQPLEPPGWIVFEALSFGTMSSTFPKLRDDMKKTIAADFGLPRERLRSWLHAASHLRNLCAHHRRIWNHTFRVASSIAGSERSHVTQHQSFYNHAVAIQTLLGKIRDDSHWARRLQALLAEHPDIPINLMGLPKNWTGQAIWQQNFGEVIAQPLSGANT